METKDKKIKLIRDQVEKAKRAGMGRPSFPKGMKENVIDLLQSGVGASNLAQMTGLSISSISRWNSESQPAAAFHKVIKEKPVKVTAAKDFSFKLTLPNGISLESSSEELLKKVFELAS